MSFQELKDKLIRKYKANDRFYKIVAVIIAVDLALVGVFAFITISYKEITVTVNGKEAKIKTMEKTVGDLLESWDVELAEKDEINMDLDTRLAEGTVIEIKEFEVENEVAEEETKFKTKEYYTSDLMEGETKVTKKGEKGKDKVTYEVSYLGGEEVDRKEVGRETVKKPVTEEVAVGTAISYNGEKYSRKLTVSATGYTHTGHRTATGTYPHRGTIAVDRRVIPMGSYGYVPGYGKVHAEDTGGAVKGNRIDLFFETRGQAIKWGRRTVTIYIK